MSHHQVYPGYPYVIPHGQPHSVHQVPIVPHPVKLQVPFSPNVPLQVPVSVPVSSQGTDRSTKSVKDDSNQESEIEKIRAKLTEHLESRNGQEKSEVQAQLVHLLDGLIARMEENKKKKSQKSPEKDAQVYSSGKDEKGKKNYQAKRALKNLIVSF